MTKYILIVGIVLLLVVVPVTIIGTVVSNPISFIGNMIFDVGDSDTISSEMEEMYKTFTSSSIYEEATAYIDELRQENIKYSYRYYIIPSLLVVDCNMEVHSIKDIGMDILIKKAWEIGEEATTFNEYIQKLKETDEFKKLNDISDTTLVMYLNQLGGTETVEGVPKSTEDLITIAQGDIYIGATNPFVASGYRGQCTWWCWSRAKELTGVTMPTGNARDWSTLTNLPVGDDPKAYSVLSLWDNGYSGRQHVIFIEDYSNGYITYSEGNIGGDGTDEYTSQHYLELLRYGKMTVEEFKRSRVLTYDNFKYIYTS